jgi:hypothetical protein
MHRLKPWLLHSLPVNTLNFCALSVCFERHALGEQSRGGTSESQHAPSSSSSERVLVAVPARDDKRIEVYQFPDEKLVAVVPRVEPTETGKLACRKDHYPGLPSISIFDDHVHPHTRTTLVAKC